MATLRTLWFSRYLSALDIYALQNLPNKGFEDRVMVRQRLIEWPLQNQLIPSIPFFFHSCSLFGVVLLRYQNWSSAYIACRCGTYQRYFVRFIYIISFKLSPMAGLLVSPVKIAGLSSLLIWHTALFLCITSKIPLKEQKKLDLHVFFYLWDTCTLNGIKIRNFCSEQPLMYGTVTYYFRPPFVECDTST